MPGKWTPTQRKKYQQTMKAKRENADFIPANEGDVIEAPELPLQDHKAKILDLIDKAMHLMNQVLK